jgi:hypothetical protein
MNSYTVHYRYAYEHVEATDSDMAVWQAAEIIDAQGIDKGELLAIELHAPNGFSQFSTPAPT